MEQITDPEILEEYCNHFPIKEYFDFDVQPYISVVKFDSDEIILQEGSKTSFLFYLMHGRAKLFISHKSGRSHRHHTMYLLCHSY